MPSLRQIRRRIRSVKGTAQLTKAMEMVAASKMRRAQAAVYAARPYAEKIREVVADLAGQGERLDDAPIHPLLERRATVERVGLILFTSDRGLAGGLNANVIRAAGSHLLGESAPVVVTAVGKKGRDWLVRFGREVRAEFVGVGDRPQYDDVIPIARVAIEDYVSGYVDRVDLIYNKFVSTLSQRPVVETLLPISPPAGNRNGRVEYIYEPSAEEVLFDLLPRFVETQIWEAMLESTASEHSARMVAMRNATENANEIVQDLTLMYNQVRQATITRELIEIVAGSGLGRV